jgi:hypothetical protein
LFRSDTVLEILGASKLNDAILSPFPCSNHLSKKIDLKGNEKDLHLKEANTLHEKKST